MSGDQLRNFAVVGYFLELKNLLAGGANPCSVDEKGLTALHYAVWNGHLQCVEILVANHWGKHHETGDVCSSINLQSKTGYTALHIVAMRMAALLEDESYDANENSDERQTKESENIECCRLLLMVGADCIALRDIEGKSAIDLAREAGNESLVSVFNSVKRPSEQQVQEFTESILAKHMMQHRRKVATTIGDPANNDIAKNNIGESGENDSWVSFHDSNIFPPCREDKILIPKELDVHEHRILPFAKKLFSSKQKPGSSGAMKIRNLVMLLDQANRNIDRREKLVNSRNKGEWQRIEF
uniref:Uncharacterized protein n=1 Tax=Ditylum brightwellii TaxID=49249 RepID=A0A7S4VTH5_9STRA